MICGFQRILSKFNIVQQVMDVTSVRFKKAHRDRRLRHSSLYFPTAGTSGFDQPEDDLDNHLIYDLIVTQLREVKRHRQIIVVTHNANMSLTEMQSWLLYAVRGGETHKDCVGSLQENQFVIPFALLWKASQSL